MMTVSSTIEEKRDYGREIGKKKKGRVADYCTIVTVLGESTCITLNMSAYFNYHLHELRRPVPPRFSNPVFKGNLANLWQGREGSLIWALHQQR